jgi:succinyl-CoA synthetase alpha subunit
VSIFVDEKTKVVVQGLTGGQGRFHGLRNRAYGTKVVAGVTPGKGGEDVEGIPVFDTVPRRSPRPAPTPPSSPCRRPAAPAAILEAAEAGHPFIVCITEFIPAQDEARRLRPAARDFPGTRLLGPNCPGIISPGKCNIGITSGDIALPAARSGSSPLGHPHLPGAARAVPAGRRPDDLRRHRRRPGARHELHRLPRGAFEADPETRP